MRSLLYLAVDISHHRQTAIQLRSRLQQAAVSVLPSGLEVPSPQLASRTALTPLNGSACPVFEGE